MCDSNDEGPSACTERWRTARKQHRCCACYEMIAPGHRYHYTSGIWDGRADSFKHCARCWAIYDKLLDIADGDSVRLDLNCGELWSENFGARTEPAELAFMLPDEAQELAP